LSDPELKKKLSSNRKLSKENMDQVPKLYRKVYLINTIAVNIMVLVCHHPVVTDFHAIIFVLVYGSS
jgi:hypothetical protein